MRALSRRLSRLDHGNWRNRELENLTDEELHGAIASHMPDPDPEAWLARWNAMTFEEQGDELRRIIERESA
jgi:hypothetical protein